MDLILIATDEQQLPSDLQQYRVIIRPSLLGDAEGFVEQMRQVLSFTSALTSDERRSEPRRLLEAKEYRAAVIAAMTLLEANLRDRLGKEAFVTASFTSLSSNRPLSLRNLLDRATANDLMIVT